MSIDGAFSDFPVLETKRLRLRQIQPEDAEAIFAIRADEQVREAYGQEPYQSLAEAHAMTERVQASYLRSKDLFWGITLKENEGVIGSCTLWNFDTDSLRCELGYELNRAYWRQGIISEAVAAVLAYGFTELALHRIEAIVSGGNAASQKLLLKLGFAHEGNLRQRSRFRGKFEDELYFGLLREEWSKKV